MFGISHNVQRKKTVSRKLESNCKGFIELYLHVEQRKIIFEPLFCFLKNFYTNKQSVYSTTACINFSSSSLIFEDDSDPLLNQ